jgi:hypothetical protein
MAQTVVLTPGLGEATSAEIVLTSGQSAHLGAYNTISQGSWLNGVIQVLRKTPGKPNIEAVLNNVNRSVEIEGPGTFIVTRSKLAGTAFGVFSDVSDASGSGGGTLPIPVAKQYLRGWHVQGLESFGTGKIPGVAGTDFNPPVEADFSYAKAKGMDVLRIGWLWERAQPALNGALDATYMGYIDNCLTQAKKYGLKLILDPCHGTGVASGGRYVAGVVYKIGTAEVPISAWTDYLVKLYQRYGNDEAIYAFDVANEPLNLPVKTTPGNYDTRKTSIQYIPNWSVEYSMRKWTAGSTFTRSKEKAWRGEWSVKQTYAGGYDNMTTENDAESGYNLPAGNYVFSCYYQAQITSGNASVVQISTVSPFGASNGGVQLASGSFPAAATWTRKEIPFVVPAGGAKVYLRFLDNGGTGVNFYDAFNITPGTAASAYIDSHFTGEPYATNTLMHQAAIKALRGAGYTGWIWLEMEMYSGPQYFTQMYGEMPDVWFEDPLHKTALSYHRYFDGDRGGSYETTWTQAGRDKLVSELAAMHAWGAAKGVRITVGETGVPSDASTSSVNYRADLNTTYTDQWDPLKMDVLYFAAGQQFSSATSIRQVAGADQAAMSVVAAHPGK